VHINAEEFARQLNQLVGYAKSGFKEIKGSKGKTEYVDKYNTTFRMNGALSQEIVDFPFLGIAYTATYMEHTSTDRGNTLFEQLRKIVAQSLPAGFIDEGIDSNDRMKIATFSTNAKKLLVEINRSNITKTITVVVRDKSH
jgi:hypothetical protein